MIILSGKRLAGQASIRPGKPEQGSLGASGTLNHQLLELTRMADKFDPYREALVMETETVWSDKFDDLAPARKAKIAEALHADPEQASQLEYVRVHTGFCRKISVTADDVERIAG
ncbi:MAG: hypothetical protein KDA60_00255 [Planctomycetales bacterium]|nr:hypothetical protein [Planctomycetales bacterium]